MANISQNGTAKLDDFVLLGARLMLAGLFLHEGLDLAKNFNAVAASMVKMGLPAPLLAATAALQLCAGALLVAGWGARLGALALGLFCVTTATLFHTVLGNRNELLHFEKDCAIAGGMFVLMIHGPGQLTLTGLLGWRSASPVTGLTSLRTEAGPVPRVEDSRLF